MNFKGLKEEALAHENKRSRLILVPGYDMVICLHKSSIVGMHRHPKFEAYHLIEGELAVLFEDDDVCILTEDNPILSIPAGVWHEPFAETEFAIYREFYCGPFVKSEDVEYAK